MSEQASAQQSGPGFDPRAAGQRLWSLWQSCQQIEALAPGEHPPGELEAYEVQDALIGAAARDGVAIAGWKVGVPDPAEQRALGLSGPVSAPLFVGMLRSSPARIAESELIRPSAEPEYAFRMARALPPRPGRYSREEVRAAVATLHPAVEIIDSRFTEWERWGGPGFIADAAGAGLLVYGKGIADWRDEDLVRLKVSLTVAGEEASGSGALAMGHPLTALTWLANHLHRRGRALRGGDLVTTGTCSRILPLPAGSEGRADFGRYGKVEFGYG